MARQILIQIIGTPTACAEGIRDSWREAAGWAGQKLSERFGDAVQVEYYDLFDPACPEFPADAQIPVVLVNSECFSSGGKLSVPAIRKQLEAIGIEPAR